MTGRTTPSEPDRPRHRFRDRRDAGRVLADLLSGYSGRDDVVVVGLARGGVPVAFEVALALHAPLDVCIVRKLGAPGYPEFAVGAIARGGHRIVNDETVAALGITAAQLGEIIEREGRELQRRETAYRLGRASVQVRGKVVIVVDDGLATGASMRAAVSALRQEQPARVVMAVPVAPDSTRRDFAELVDELVCASMPASFLAVGQSYQDFSQVGDDEVRTLLATPTTDPAPGPPAARRVTDPRS